MRTVIWAAIVVAIWVSTIVVTYDGAWNYGYAAGVNWSRIQIFGK